MKRWDAATKCDCCGSLDIEPTYRYLYTPREMFGEMQIIALRSFPREVVICTCQKCKYEWFAFTPATTEKTILDLGDWAKMRYVRQRSNDAEDIIIVPEYPPGQILFDFDPDNPEE